MSLCSGSCQKAGLRPQTTLKRRPASVEGVEAGFSVTFFKKISPHHYRHHFAQQLYSNSIDLLQIKNLMRHVNSSTTERYINISKESMKAAYKDTFK